MKSGFRATRSPFVNILAFFNVVASRQISPHRSCKGTMFIHICKIFLAHLQSSVFKLSKDLIDSIHEEGIVAYTS